MYRALSDIEMEIQKPDKILLSLNAVSNLSLLGSTVYPASAATTAIRWPTETNAFALLIASFCLMTHSSGPG